MFTSRFEEFCEINIMLMFLCRATIINWLSSLFALLIELLELNRTPPSSIKTIELFLIFSMSETTFIHEGISSSLNPIAKHSFLCLEWKFSRNFIPNAVLPDPLAPKIIPI